MSDKKPLEVKCPSCSQQVEWVERNAFRPFCSETCKNKDFIGWANEEKTLAGNNLYDDVFSDQAPE